MPVFWLLSPATNAKGASFISIPYVISLDLSSALSSGLRAVLYLKNSKILTSYLVVISMLFITLTQIMKIIAVKTIRFFIFNPLSRKFFHIINLTSL